MDNDAWLPSWITMPGSLQAGAPLMHRTAVELASLQQRLDRVEADVGALVRSLEGGSIPAPIAAALADLRAEVELRAYLSSLEATDEAVTALGKDVRGVARTAEVALRFINWYTAHGESFESGGGGGGGPAQPLQAPPLQYSMQQQQQQQR